MNAIQQISLKLQMGIDPAADIRPELLRFMWQELTRERAGQGYGGTGPSHRATRFSPASYSRSG